MCGGPGHCELRGLPAASLIRAPNSWQSAWIAADQTICAETILFISSCPDQRAGWTRASRNADIHPGKAWSSGASSTAVYCILPTWRTLKANAGVRSCRKDIRKA